MKPVVTFGEIMGRLAAPENIRYDRLMQWN